MAKWLGRQSYLDDLASLDKDLYKGLIMLKNYPNPEELALNFTVTEQGMPQYLRRSFLSSQSSVRPDPWI